jgi:hypothetical protein
MPARGKVNVETYRILINYWILEWNGLTKVIEQKRLHQRMKFELVNGEPVETSMSTTAQIKN